MRAAARDFPDAHVGMVDGNVLALVKVEAEQAMRGVERRLNHLLELEVGHDLGFIEIVTLLAQFFGIVAPVPGGQFEIAAFLRDHRLQRLCFFLGAPPRRCPDLIE